MIEFTTMEHRGNIESELKVFKRYANPERIAATSLVVKISESDLKKEETTSTNIKIFNTQIARELVAVLNNFIEEVEGGNQ